MRSGATAAAVNTGGRASATATGPWSSIRSPAASATSPAAAEYDSDMSGAVPVMLPDSESTVRFAPSIAGLADTDRPAASGPDSVHAAAGSAAAVASTCSLNTTLMRSGAVAAAETTVGLWPSAARRPTAPGNEWWLSLPRSGATSTAAVSSAPAAGSPKAMTCTAVPDPARLMTGGRAPEG